jgi:hypothetical protein
LPTPGADRVVDPNVEARLGAPRWSL